MVHIVMYLSGTQLMVVTRPAAKRYDISPLIMQAVVAGQDPISLSEVPQSAPSAF
mgnify:CR=1 FL=1